MSYCPVFLHLYDIRYKNLLVEVECLAIILNWYKHLTINRYISRDPSATQLSSNQLAGTLTQSLVLTKSSSIDFSWWARLATG